MKKRGKMKKREGRGRRGRSGRWGERGEDEEEGEGEEEQLGIRVHLSLIRCVNADLPGSFHSNIFKIVHGSFFWRLDTWACG